MLRPLLGLCFSVLLVLWCDGEQLTQLEHVEVFLIPHSHCDVGWQKTVNGYYTEQVRDILNGVTECLEERNSNPDPRLVRKFNWDVQAFFQKYWNEITPEWQETIRAQVRDGRLGFAGYGWVQSDEATTEAFGRVMQMTEGHIAIDRLFPEVTEQARVCWQIDPFGASSLSPTLFAKSGFDAVVNTRIPRMLQDAFRANKSLEFVWKGNPLGESYPMLWHNMGDGVHPYATPGDPPEAWGGREGFRWEDPLWSNPLVTEDNVASRAAVFASVLRVRSTWFQPGAPLLIPFGADFLFQDAHIEFDNMDKVLEEINNNYDTYKMSIQYATVQEWVSAMKEANLEFPVYEQSDFFPYNKAEGNIWGGFFTTRPLLKRLIREGEAHVRAAEMLQALAGIYKLPEEVLTLNEDVFEAYFKAGYLLDQARQEVSIGHHHDATTGTSKHEVVSDYFDRLTAAKDLSLTSLGISASVLLCDTAEEGGLGTPDCPVLEGFTLTGNSSTLIDTASFQERERAVLVLFNSLGAIREEMVSIRCSSLVSITDAAGDDITSSATFLEDAGGEFYRISFVVDLPALGLGTFYVERKSDEVGQDCFTQEAAGTEDHMSIGNDWLQVNINATTGGISSITSFIGPFRGQEIPVNQEFYQYFSPKSDAYQFTPTSIDRLSSGMEDVTIVIRTCDLYQEAVVSVTDQMTITYRVPQLLGRTKQFGMQGLGVEMFVDAGEMEYSRELVQRFQTGWKTENRWYTDNGLAIDQHQVRRTDLGLMRDTSQNYKPVRTSAMLVNSALPLEDLRTSSSVAGLLLLTGQPAGTVSMEEGTLEVMIHRKTGTSVWQDFQGAVSYYRLMVGPVSWLEAARSHQNLQVQYPVEVLYSPIPTKSWPYGSFMEPLGADSLPIGTHLFSFAAVDFVALAIPDTSYEEFITTLRSGSRTYAMRPELVDAGRIAVRMQNLYPEGISEARLPLLGCQVIECEERGLTLLPLRHNHKFEQHSSWKNQPYFLNQQYTVTALDDMEVFHDSCDSFHLSAEDIRTFVFTFDCV